MKLGSLFDGIGGFPHAAEMLGIESVWASEIEKFPIAVTKIRFPNMKHLGSVCDIKGAEVELVDIITFGSPCQDLSVAGKRAGMGEGTRSGLFTEAVRIIKEMRSGTDGRYPRFAVWENVPGAYSSNNGEDFRAVIESLAKVADSEIKIPSPPNGKWEPAGMVEGWDYSIAWRTLDAQFWGVPQRRKRIFLVADFGGQCASKIFFEREGVFGNTAESGGSGQEVTGGVAYCARTANTGANGHGIAENASHTLDGTGSHAVYPTNGMAIGKELKGDDRQTTDIGEDGEPSPTIRAQGHQHSVAFVIRSGCECGGKGYLGSEEKALTLDTVMSQKVHCVHATQDPITAVNRTHALGANSSQAVCFEPRSQDGEPRIIGDFSPPLNTAQGGQRQPCVCLPEDKHSMSLASRAHCQGVIAASQDRTAIGFDGYNSMTIGEVSSSLGTNCGLSTGRNGVITNTVRRLTPLECEKLQGFPMVDGNGWTDIPGASDSARYKALGNSVAIPCVKFILECIKRSDQ